MAPDRVELRRTFNRATELYERARPTDPPALLDCIASLIDSRYGGRIRKPYMTSSGSLIRKTS